MAPAPPGFRAEAVRLALASGLSRRQVAADLGIGIQSSSRHPARNRANHRWYAAPGNENVPEARRQSAGQNADRDVSKLGEIYGNDGVFAKGGDREEMAGEIRKPARRLRGGRL